MSDGDENEGRTVGEKDDAAHDLPTEFMDDTADSHAVMFGFWQGVRSVNPKPKYSESVENPHYFQFGYVLGWLVKLGVIGVMGAEYAL